MPWLWCQGKVLGSSDHQHPSEGPTRWPLRSKFQSRTPFPGFTPEGDFSYRQVRSEFGETQQQRNMGGKRSYTNVYSCSGRLSTRIPSTSTKSTIHIHHSQPCKALGGALYYGSLPAHVQAGTCTLGQLHHWMCAVGKKIRVRWGSWPWEFPCSLHQVMLVSLLPPMDCRELSDVLLTQREGGKKEDTEGKKCA